MGHPLGCTDHIGAGLIHWKRRFGRAENDIPAHARRQVQHNVRVAVAHAVGDLTVECQIPAGLACLRVADVTMHNSSPSLGGRNCAFGNLLG